MIFKFTKKQAREIAYGTKKNPKPPWPKPSKPKNPLEKVIEKQVCQHAKDLGCLVYKFTSMGKRSVPDRLFILPGGKHIFIEFKRKGEVPTDAQALEIEKIEKQGGCVYVVDNVDRGQRVLDYEIAMGDL